MFLLLLRYEVLPEEDSMKRKGCCRTISADCLLGLSIIHVTMDDLQTNIINVLSRLMGTEIMNMS